MAKSSKYTSKIASIENELNTVRHELALLQSSRSHRTAKFIRQLISSSPSEVPSILRQFPDLLRKYSVPTPEEKQNRIDLFNPLTNPLPLYKYPAINVGLVASGKSRVATAFTVTCNATPLSSSHARELIRYNALQLVVVDLSHYKAGHFNAVKEAVDNGSKLLVFAPKNSNIPSELNDIATETLDISTDKTSALPPFADIYSATPKTIPRTLNSEQPVSTIKTARGIEAIAHDSLSILSSELLQGISHESACVVLEKIASYHPILVDGDKPDWLPESVWNYKSEDELEQLISKLREPYAAERYSINCGRQAILEKNALSSIPSLLLKAGLIDNLPSEKPKISVVLSTRRPQFLEQTLEQLEKQTLKPHEVILMLHGVPEEDRRRVDKVVEGTKLSVKYEFVDKSVLFGDVLNMAIDKASGEFSTKVDDDDYYLPNHLLDLYAAHLSSRADFVGKWNHWVYIQADDETISWSPENANVYVRHIPGGTLFGKTSTFREVRFGKVRRAIDSELYRRAEIRGATLYSSHRYNYIRVRHDDHTYTASNADFKSRSDKHTIKGLPLEDLGV